MKLDREFLQAALSARSLKLGAKVGALAGVSTDTRSLTGGELFIALRGERFDAHDFVEAALEAGAGSALVERSVAGVDDANLIIVDDALRGLQDVAQAWLAQSSATRICLSGSNGKTTTKELLAAALTKAFGAGKVLSTEGNLNNHIGMPLTALKLEATHRVSVLELGMNHFGELSRLCEIARPEIVLLTNIGTAHAGNLGGPEGVARAKAELFAGLMAGGIAIVNLDDRQIVAAAERTLSSLTRQVTFGTRQGEISVQKVTAIAGGMQVVLRHAGEEASVDLPLVGEHNAVNAAAAVATAIAAGAPFARAVEGLAFVKSVPGRLAVHEDVAGRLVLDDSYNANPDSARVALSALLARSGTRRPVAVLGDMLELGPDEHRLHAEIAAEAVAAGVKQLFVCGAMRSAYVEGGRSAGLSDDAIVFFPDSQALAPRVVEGTGPGDAILIKGSRGARMEIVLEALLNSASSGSTADKVSNRVGES